jgi:hypothetical protein
MNTKLSDKKIQALKPKAKAYRLNDDNGLSCFVTPSGKRFGRFRYMWLGPEKMFSMGEYPHTSLELARKKVPDAHALRQRPWPAPLSPCGRHSGRCVGCVIVLVGGAVTGSNYAS